MDNLNKRIIETQRIVEDNWINDYKMTIIENQLAIMKTLEKLEKKINTNLDVSGNRSNHGLL
jgi:hypothetical protein